MIEDLDVEWARAMDKAKIHVQVLSAVAERAGVAPEVHAQAAEAWVTIAREFREAADHAIQS